MTVGAPSEFCDGQCVLEVLDAGRDTFLPKGTAMFWVDHEERAVRPETTRPS